MAFQGWFIRTQPARAAAVVALAALLTASVAHAGAFAVREQSARGQGASFAGVAAGGSLSSMFWNPATLSQIMGFEVEAVGSGVFATADVETTAPAGLAPTDEGNIAEDIFVPAFFGAYRVSNHIIVGLGVNGQFGLVTDYDDTSFIRAAGIAGRSDLFSINVNPALAIQITDYVTLGVGAMAQWFDATFTDAAIAAPAVGIADLEGDGWGYGFTAGIQVMPMEGTEIGLGYRSAIDNDISGDIDITVAGPAVIETSFDATLDLPDMVTFGVRHTVNDYLRVMAGIEWTNWSRFDTVTVATPLGSLAMPFDYEDGWFFALGGEYMHSDRLTLRAGVGWEETPIDDAARTFRLPDGDRLWLSAGLSYVLDERFSLDLGYSFIKAFGTDIENANPLNGGALLPAIATADVDGRIHIISAAIKAKFGGAKPTSEPVVARY